MSCSKQAVAEELTVKSLTHDRCGFLELPRLFLHSLVSNALREELSSREIVPHRTNARHHLGHIYLYLHVPVLNEGPGDPLLVPRTSSGLGAFVLFLFFCFFYVHRCSVGRRECLWGAGSNGIGRCDNIKFLMD